MIVRDFWKALLKIESGTVKNSPLPMYLPNGEEIVNVVGGYGHKAAGPEGVSAGIVFHSENSLRVEADERQADAEVAKMFPEDTHELNLSELEDGPVAQSEIVEFDLMIRPKVNVPCQKDYDDNGWIDGVLDAGITYLITNLVELPTLWYFELHDDQDPEGLVGKYLVSKLLWDEQIEIIHEE
jgi:hypothetical protein